MNDETLFAVQVRRELDESAGRLPARVTERLAQGRRLAIERAGRLQQSDAYDRSVGIVHRYGLVGVETTRRHLTVPRWALAALVPVAVAASIFGVAQLNAERELDDNADLEAAVMLDDDVPIAAYADSGFGVFLANHVQKVRADAGKP